MSIGKCVFISESVSADLIADTSARDKHKADAREKELIRKYSIGIIIFDEIRKKWIVCTPEEWVRQNLVRFLVQDCAYPQALVALEKQVLVAERSLRFDALIYDREFSPLMLIECKAPTVKLTQKVFDQIWHYNYEIKAPFFIVTNGIDFIMGRYDAGKGVEFFETVKAFEELVR